MNPYIGVALRREIIERAGNCCEYQSSSAETEQIQATYHRSPLVLLLGLKIPAGNLLVVHP